MSDKILHPSKIEMEYVATLEQNLREIACAFVIDTFLPARIHNEDLCGSLSPHGEWSYLHMEVEE